MQKRLDGKTLSGPDKTAFCPTIYEETSCLSERTSKRF